MKNLSPHSYKDEAGNDWTLADLLADLDRKDNLYLTPKMCADLAQHLRSRGPNGKAWEKVWISQDVIMHLQGIEAQAGKLSDAINLFKRFESEARTDATGDRHE